MKIGVAKNKKKIFVYLSKKNIELHPLWLRERVNGHGLLDVNTGQRLYDPAFLSKKLKIEKAHIQNKNLNIHEKIKFNIIFSFYIYNISSRVSSRFYSFDRSYCDFSSC